MYLKVNALTNRLAAGDKRAVLFYKFTLSVSFAVLTGLSAQLRLILPVTPVPVTAQTVVVLLSGIFLGPVFGALSQVMYLSWGLVGMPWFSGVSFRGSTLNSKHGTLCTGRSDRRYQTGHFHANQRNCQ